MVSTPAFAAPILNPDNGHYYQLVNNTGITWTDAKTAAEAFVFSGLNGHLATITSQSENNFVAGLSQNDFRAWIGLSDVTTEGNYEWITDEPFSYSNWAHNEPYGGYENYIEFFASNDKWNDNLNYNGLITGYIVEYSSPDINPVQNPQNGHYYKLVSDPGIQWTDAKTAAEAITHNGTSGHLVTITSQNENAFVAGLSSDDFNPWIGLSKANSEGVYKWVTGEPLNYTNWILDITPNDNRDYVILYESQDKWSDAYNNYYHITSYIVEFTP